MEAHAHHERKARSVYIRPGFKARKGPGSSRVFRCSLVLSEPYVFCFCFFKHSDAKWDKKNIVDVFCGGGGGAPNAPPPPPLDPPS